MRPKTAKNLGEAAAISMAAAIIRPATTPLPWKRWSSKKKITMPASIGIRPCPTCGEKMILRHGRFGPFLGCSRYPDCNGIVNIPKKGERIYQPGEMPNCPAIGCDGRIVARKSRFGKVFFSCSNFPACDVIANALEDLPTKYATHQKTAYVKKTALAGRGKKKRPLPKRQKPKKPRPNPNSRPSSSPPI